MSQAKDQKVSLPSRPYFLVIYNALLLKNTITKASPGIPPIQDSPQLLAPKENCQLLVQLRCSLKGIWIDLKTLHEWISVVKTRWYPAFYPNLI